MAEGKHTKAFLEQQELQKGDLAFVKLKHKMKMEELVFERGTNRIFHERSLERDRIRRAENRKDFREKQAAWRHSR